MKICPKCKAVNDDSDSFCKECGTPLEAKVETSVKTSNADNQPRFQAESQAQHQVQAQAQAQPQATGPVAAFKYAFIEKYACLKGRASRSEYWYYVLGAAIVNLILNFIFAFFEGPATAGSGIGITVGLRYIISLIFMVAGFCAIVRRLHDTDRSGKWIFILLIPILGALVMLYWLVKQGTQGDNQYGTFPPRYF